VVAAGPVADELHGVAIHLRAPEAVSHFAKNGYGLMYSLMPFFSLFAGCIPAAFITSRKASTVGGEGLKFPKR
jgi:hypothetical protein